MPASWRRTYAEFPQPETQGRPFAALRRLRLDGTAITDAGLAHLTLLEGLTYLNLVGTSVTDAGLEAIAGLAALQRVYLWRTAVTAQGVARLGGQRSTLEVVAAAPSLPQEPAAEETATEGHETQKDDPNEAADAVRADGDPT